MPAQRRKVLKNLFNYETTGRTDFRDGEIKPLGLKQELKEKPERPREPYEPVKYLQTMTPWRTPAPFNTMMRLRPIVQTNPWKVQEPHHHPVDLEREECQRTRPRLVMTPSVSIDDITDSRVRQIIVEDMYQSTIMKEITFAAKAAFPDDTNKAPLPGTYTGGKPLTLPVMQPPYVSTEWRMDTIPWDQRQLRSYSDVTREFWLSPEHAPTRCSSCAESNKVAALRKMKM